ncbi:pancreatic lipase-related protein 2-like [Harmonia axyridis]|uniref:pancreatic lipase-related protein 2-like n=1 Tax=Harmonia axyridis TaxID=115357 RepID=UPI001E276029|nr:pancreatic lipase-related protein 2-like [Harmonia axyridis]
MDLAAPFAGLITTVTLVATVFYMNGYFNQKKFADLNNNTDANEGLDPNGPDVQFILHKRNSSPFNLRLHDQNKFDKSKFNITAPTKIIIHGFMSSIKQEVFTLNKDAFLKTGDYNVIGMDWSALCEFEYLSAMRGAQIASQYLVEMVEWLVMQGVSLKDMHLVGHSLGAHVAGMAGSKLRSGKVSRITGLDPALPGYNERGPHVKLDPSDAELVEVIHTYMKILGYARPLGHIDFYANGGRYQPGCPDIYDIWKIGESLHCNHARSYQYFAESVVNPKAFKCTRCVSVEEALGENCFEETDIYLGQPSTYRSGLYFFRTRKTQPYAPPP